MNIIGERYTLSHVKLSGGINISLTVSPLTVQDEGTYTCTATVNVGNNISQRTTASDTVQINIHSKSSEDIFLIVYYHLTLRMQLYKCL